MLEPIIMNTNHHIDSVVQWSGGGVVEALWCTGTCGLIQCLRQLSVVAVHYFCDPLFRCMCQQFCRGPHKYHSGDLVGAVSFLVSSSCSVLLPAQLGNWLCSHHVH